MDQLSVLIVDGNKSRGALLGKWLKRYAFEVAYTPTIPDARECLKQKHYQLLVLEVNGQHRNAYQFCRQVRQDLPSLRVVAVLPEIDPEVEVRLFDCGVVDVASAGHATAAILSKRINLLLSPRATRPFQKP